jgi:hypothetical protein
MSSSSVLILYNSYINDLEFTNYDWFQDIRKRLNFKEDENYHLVNFNGII